MSLRPCENCGKEFEPARDWQRFCQPVCRVTAWRQSHPRIPVEMLPKLLRETRWPVPGDAKSVP